MRTSLCFLVLLLSTAIILSCEAPIQEEQETTLQETTTETPPPTTAIAEDGEYMQLDADMPISDYTGQKIWIEGTISTDPMQHMMKEAVPFGEEEQHLYIAYNDGEETVGYYTNLEIPTDDQNHRFYGTVDKISGAGKGGDTHTEYFINLEKIE